MSILVKMKKSLIRLSRTDPQNYKIISSQSKQQVIIKCKHCDSEAVKAKTPSGTTLYYCCSKFCNFSGKIVSRSLKQQMKKTDSCIFRIPKFSLLS